jgi:hypothetical protein
VKRLGYLAMISAVVPLMAFGPAERAAPTHWALVIGISDYIHFDDAEGGDLPGAQHDAQVMRDFFLDKAGFPEDNVRMVLNQAATRAALEEAAPRCGTRAVTRTTAWTRRWRPPT